MDLLTEMRIPTRAAPKPPGSNTNSGGVSQAQKTSGHLNDVWGCGSNDLFGSSLQVTQKKKPPPRPPPPNLKNLQKSLSVNIQEKPKKPARPTELLSNLFGRKGTKQPQHQHYNSTFSNYSSTSTTTAFSTTSRSSTTTSSNNQSFQSAWSSSRTTESNNVGSLIDLSPPGSPTFTTRSSSDGVSVDSFGSDGNSNPSAFTSSGSTSQTESAFEDDFDFFGSLTANSTSAANKKLPANDPWKVSCSQDPFGSFDSSPFGGPSKTITSQHQWATNSQPTKEVGESSFFVPRESSPFDATQPKPFRMPTIIRVKPTKEELTPKQSPVHVPGKSTSFSTNNYSSAPRLDPSKTGTDIISNIGEFETEKNLDFCWDDDKAPDNSSPPMPSLPPPPPPPEYIAGLEDGLVENSERPYGIALYDFPASQHGDLELKEGDVVYLTKLINDNWMEGRVGNREGMFPINFVNVKICLPGVLSNMVNALYTFKAETSEDLSFEEGAKIKVLSKITDDWLYGECEGKKGQFPANFVDKVPNNLPNYS